MKTLIKKTSIDKKFFPTDEYKKELIEFIETCCEMEFENYITTFEENRDFFGKKIFDFYRLPKTELHELFNEKILKKSIDRKNKRLDFAMRKKMQSNLDKAYFDKKFMGSVGKYMVANRIHLKSGEKIKVCGLQYMAKIKGQFEMVEKYGYTELVSNIKHKTVYESIK